MPASRAVHETGGRFTQARPWLIVVVVTTALFVIGTLAIWSTRGSESSDPSALRSTQAPVLQPALEPTSRPTQAPEAALTELSELGAYRVTLIPEHDPVRINVLHSWTLQIESLDGELIDDAAPTIDGDMPEHGHGLPTRPQVTQALGNGRYLIEGMKFQMSGWWVLDVTFEVNGVTDRAHFELTLR